MGLVATAVSADQINLSWNDNAANETSYLVEQLPEGNVTWIEIASLSANATTYQDTGLASNTTYQYRIRAHRTEDNLYSAYSNIAQAKTDWLLYLPIILRP
jgi:titin